MERSPADVYTEHCHRRELAYQVGGDGRPVFRPRVGPSVWRVSAGVGTVYATTVARPRRADSGEAYNIVLVDLDEGFRMMSTVVGVAPEDVAVGARVRLAWRDGEADGRRAGAGLRAVGGSHVTGVAIAGAAEAQMGKALPGLSAADVMAEAARAALADAGLTVADVDGVFAAATQLPWASVTLAEELGIRPRHTDSTMIGGASAMAHVNHARAAIAAGLCDVALIAYGSTQRSVGRASASVQEIDPWEAPYRPPLPVAAYALAASRHMHEYGTTAEQLAWVAVERAPVGAAARRRVVARRPHAGGRRSPRRASATRSACATAAWSPTAARRSW